MFNKNCPNKCIKGKKNKCNLKKLVLAGNPNSGKSVFFNYLTGMYVDVSNYPGTTLEISNGYFQNYHVFDTPGVYGISSFNDEEKVARDVILNADIVLNVVNAVYLERDLFLTQQIIDTGVPVIIALNMIDEAKYKGINIDIEKLEALLGVPVIPTTATKKEGLEDIVQSLKKAKSGNSDEGLQKQINNLLKNTAIHTKGEALLILEGDANIAARHNIEPFDEQAKIYSLRRKKINKAIENILSYDNKKQQFNRKLSHLLINTWTGLPILLFLLFIIYKIIGVFIAGSIVGFTEETIMIGKFEPFIRSIINPIINPDSILGFILTGEFGLLTMTFTYVLGLLMPLVVGFYFFLSLFEDSGYLPRIATLTDSILNRIGLNGRAIIPLILGFGCVTVATITTRLLGSEREKKIAIFLLGLAIPCSAQLGIITGMLTKLSLPLIILYLVVIITVLVTVGTLLNILLPGRSSDLFIDLPPLRLPQTKNVFKKTFNKSYQFLLEAFPLFAFGALLISTLKITGGLTAIQNFMAPLTVYWLDLPIASANAFLMGMIRRDFGAVGLMKMNLSEIQVVISLITITLFVPCIATVMVMFKERSKKEALMMWGGTWVIAFFIGGVIAQLSNLIGVDTTWKILLICAIFIGLSLTSIFAAKPILNKKILAEELASNPNYLNHLKNSHHCYGNCLSCLKNDKKDK